MLAMGALIGGAGRAAAAAAEASAAGTAGDAVQTGSILAPLIRMIGSLALVFAILFLGVWIFRNWQSMLRRGGVAPRLRVLEVKSLGARQALYVVGYERQRFLIASSPAGIVILSPLPDAPEASAEAPVPAPSFADALQKVLGKS